MAGSGSNTLRAVLNELGWSYSRLAAELRRHANVALPKTESMVTLISRWVNNHQQPDDFYRDLLSRATGRTRAELFSQHAIRRGRNNVDRAPGRVIDGNAEDLGRRCRQVPGFRSRLDRRESGTTAEGTSIPSPGRLRRRPARGPFHLEEEGRRGHPPTRFLAHTARWAFHALGYVR